VSQPEEPQLTAADAVLLEAIQRLVKTANAMKLYPIGQPTDPIARAQRHIQQVDDTLLRIAFRFRNRELVQKINATRAAVRQAQADGTMDGCWRCSRLPGADPIGLTAT
jgi:hypothetical protein